MMKIRAFQMADKAAVIDLWAACGLLVPHNDPEKDIERKLRRHPEGFLVGTIDGSIVATCMAGYEGHRGWINYLAVSPTHRRIGFGRRMMAAAEGLLSAVGCPKINLQVRSSNADVMAFYAAIGFTVDDVVSMGKRLLRD
jgi:ribosomal protein S18 acetylase RimI-like enzyme